VQQQGDRLDRLAQAHVIGQTRAEAPPPQERQPREPTQLVGPQLADKTVGGGHWLQSFIAREGIEQVREPIIEQHLAHRKAVDIGLRAEGERERLT